MTIEQEIASLPTPETDAAELHGQFSQMVIADLARRLEQQRDYAVGLLEEMRWHIGLRADADEVDTFLAAIRGDRA